MIAAESTVAIIIPFRDRGIDPLRVANLKRVLQHWDGLGITVHVVDDGRAGNAPFCRSAAYNHGAAITQADILVYVEADVIKLLRWPARPPVSSCPMQSIVRSVQKRVNWYATTPMSPAGT